jgi:hypothetical protein
LLDCEIQCWRLISTLRRLRVLLLREELALRSLDRMLWRTVMTSRRALPKGTGEALQARGSGRNRGNGAA